jgi:predicted DNA binding CopG/RHH family protein
LEIEGMEGLRRILTAAQQQKANTRSYAFVKKDRKINPEKYAKYDRDWRTRHPERDLITRAKKRAKAKGLPFNLQEFDIVIPRICPILGIPIFMGEGTICDNSPSLDRINHEHGYVPKNIQVISAKANAMKNNASRAELVRFAEWVMRTYGSPKLSASRD